MNYNPITDADILFLDVGQGDCVHIKSEETDILIDGGGSVDYNVGEKIIKPYLLKNGFINRTPRGRVVTDDAYRHLGLEIPM